MKLLIIVAKFAITLVWGALIWNIIEPFPGRLSIALYAMTGFMVIMHGVQMLIFMRAFGEQVTMTRWQKWSILIFGVFALLGMTHKPIPPEEE